MATNSGWYAIENEFWCPCQERLSSTFYTDNEVHAPDCVAIKHSILLKVSESMEYNPEVIPQREEGKGRNSVVEEFLANLETLNNTRRRSSSKLLSDFVLCEEMIPAVLSKEPGLEVYLPLCFSPKKLEKLTNTLDKDTFQVATAMSESLAQPHENKNTFETDTSGCTSVPSDFTTLGIAGQSVENPSIMSGAKEKQRKETNLSETTEIFSSFSLGETGRGKKTSSSQRNVTERVRRNTLNEKFKNLQNSIPDIADDEKISKVNILKTAMQYIRKLEQEERVYSQLQEKEKARNKRLLCALIKFNSEAQLGK